MLDKTNIIDHWHDIVMGIKKEREKKTTNFN